MGLQCSGGEPAADGPDPVLILWRSQADFQGRIQQHDTLGVAMVLERCHPIQELLVGFRRTWVVQGLFCQVLDQGTFEKQVGVVQCLFSPAENVRDFQLRDGSQLLTGSCQQSVLPEAVVAPADNAQRKSEPCQDQQQNPVWLL